MYTELVHIIPSCYCCCYKQMKENYEFYERYNFSTYGWCFVFLSWSIVNFFFIILNFKNLCICKSLLCKFMKSICDIFFFFPKVLWSLVSEITFCKIKMFIIYSKIVINNKSPPLCRLHYYKVVVVHLLTFKGNQCIHKNITRRCFMFTVFYF